MRIVQVSPVFFGEEGIVGGGERYPLELAHALAREVPTSLVSFSPRPRREQRGALAVRLYRPWWYVRGKRTNPFSLAWLPALASVDVVHTHQYRTAMSNLAILFGSLAGKRVFVTDEGGGGYHWGNRLRLGTRVAGHLAISAFAAQSLPGVGRRREVIYGGVDVERFRPGGTRQPHRVVAIGRILPHKGYDVLLRAAESHWEVHIAGRVYHPSYFAHLQELAATRGLSPFTETTLLGPLRFTFERKLYFVFLVLAAGALLFAKNLQRSPSGRAMTYMETAVGQAR